MTTYFKAFVSTEDKENQTLSYIADHDIARLDHVGENKTRLVLKSRAGVNRQYVDLYVNLSKAFEKVRRAPHNGECDLTDLQKAPAKPAASLRATR